jgi:hypothetical protein
LTGNIPNACYFSISRNNTSPSGLKLALKVPFSFPLNYTIFLSEILHELGLLLSDIARIYLLLGLQLWLLALNLDRVPYYVVFSRYTNRLRFFQLTGGHYYDNQGNWVATDAERANLAEAQLQQVALNLLRQGMTLEQVAQLTGLSLEQVQRIADER